MDEWIDLLYYSTFFLFLSSRYERVPVTVRPHQESVTVIYTADMTTDYSGA